MGCLFGCFRVRDEDRGKGGRLVATLGSSRSRENLVSKNQLASVFLCEDIESNSGQNSSEGELKHEAKFLKAWGTLLKTPVEIQKASEKISVQNLEKDGLSTSHSQRWLPDIPCKKLEWEEETHPTPFSHVSVRDSEEFAECNPGSLTKKVWPGNKNSNTLSSLLSEPQSVDPPCSISSVHFSGLNDQLATKSLPESADLNTFTPQIGNGSKLLGRKWSPYPTPLKLSDEMQTPGTVFPTDLEDIGTGQNARIRTQYVYPIVNPESQWNKATGESNELALSADLSQDHMPQSPGNALKGGTVVVPLTSNSDYQLKTVNSLSPPVESLSKWLKPPVPDNERRTREPANSGKSSDCDRPIIGSVAAHWNECESSHISPKSWDGNGIPNSTNKYKEDQKVSWHATPFEERLEKALSEGTLFPERNFKAKPINFDDEDDGADTASS